jgi:hypothetical protein
VSRRGVLCQPPIRGSLGGVAKWRSLSHSKKNIGKGVSMLQYRFAVACIAFALISCSQSKPDGRNEVEARIQDQSHGLIQLVSYTKTNGVDTADEGEGYYRLYFRTEIVFLDDVWWSGPDSTGWLGNFCAIKSQHSAYRHNTRAAKGDHIVLDGYTDYRMTDNGWQALRDSC